MDHRVERTNTVNYCPKHISIFQPSVVITIQIITKTHPNAVNYIALRYSIVKYIKVHYYTVQFSKLHYIAI